jgi:hypothetical protein
LNGCAFSARTTFHLPLQHDELLTQERVFKHQFRLAAHQVQDCIQSKSLVVRLRPTTKTMFGIVAQRIQASSDEGREVETHDPPFWSASGGHDYTMKSGLKSKCLSVLRLLHQNPERLLTLIGWPPDGCAFSASTAVTTPLRGDVVLQVVHSLEKGAF